MATRVRKTTSGNGKRMLVQLLCAVILTTVGAGLIIGAFIVPPQGEIHPSVLVAFGEILTFVGAIFGVDYHYKYKMMQ